MKQAEKFGRPVITFIDTPGAYPGKEAEERGQGEAIARNLAEMSALTVPVVAVVTGEGSSGGALALGVANRVLMLENAIYSVLSPEGFASILWKDSSRHEEACDVMKLTAQDLLNYKVIDEIVPEPRGGAQLDHKALFDALDAILDRNLNQLSRMGAMRWPAPATKSSARWAPSKSGGNNWILCGAQTRRFDILFQSWQRGLPACRGGCMTGLKMIGIGRALARPVRDER